MLNVFQGDPLTLVCSFESHPLITTLDWTWNGEVLMPDAVISITTNFDTPVTGHSVLMIGRTSRYAGGNYGCNATNEIGDGEIIFILNVIGKSTVIAKMYSILYTACHILQ